MPTLDLTTIGELLKPFYPPVPRPLLQQLSIYLDLLLKWNSRTNLTSIRDPEEIVRRHFGESLFVAAHLPECSTLLDLGSGAGFPGLPIQLALPSLRVTLAESQSKKASFLREVIRTLDLDTRVWHGRIEDMPAEQRFDVVTLRAVDRPDQAIRFAWERVAEKGIIAHLSGHPTAKPYFSIPGTEKTCLQFRSRV